MLGRYGAATSAWRRERPLTGNFRGDPRRSHRRVPIAPSSARHRPAKGRAAGLKRTGPLIGPSIWRKTRCLGATTLAPSASLTKEPQALWRRLERRCSYRHRADTTVSKESAMTSKYFLTIWLKSIAYTAAGAVSIARENSIKRNIAALALFIFSSTSYAAHTATVVGTATKIWFGYWEYRYSVTNNATSTDDIELVYADKTTGAPVVERLWRGDRNRGWTSSTMPTTSGGITPLHLLLLAAILVRARRENSLRSLRTGRRQATSTLTMKQARVARHQSGHHSSRHCSRSEAGHAQYSRRIWNV